MKWWLFTAAAATSLLLSLTTLVLWPVGYWRRHALLHTTTWTQLGIVSETGNIGLTRYVYDSPRPTRWQLNSFPASPRDPADPLAVLDFGHADVRRASLHYDSVWFPNWLPATLFAIPPALWAVQSRRRARAVHGRCPHCGHDLRATPERCPECGAVPSSPPAGH
jgi:hypothetical protein